MLCATPFFRTQSAGNIFFVALERGAFFSDMASGGLFLVK